MSKMNKLSKEMSLYDRDEEGKLIPMNVELELDAKDAKQHPHLVGNSVSITPMPRGEIKRLFNLSGKVDDVKPETDKDADGDLIMKHCFSPLYDANDVPFIKPVIARSIVATIFRESGIKIDPLSGQKKVEDDEFGKN